MLEMPVLRRRKEARTEHLAERARSKDESGAVETGTQLIGGLKREALVRIQQIVPGARRVGAHARLALKACAQPSAAA